MSKQEQIDAVALVLEKLIPTNSCEVATYLVDAGIGTKDRFEVVTSTYALPHSPDLKGAKTEVNPIDYRKKEQKGETEEKEAAPEKEPEAADTEEKESSSVESFATPESSNIHSVSYDAGKELLEVTFKGGGVYKYLAVPETLFRGMRNAESKGKYFNAEIKSKFAHEKVR